jgi:hypothetical protein
LRLVYDTETIGRYLDLATDRQEEDLDAPSAWLPVVRLDAGRIANGTPMANPQPSDTLRDSSMR